jgi:hypothetical protein
MTKTRRPRPSLLPVAALVLGVGAVANETRPAMTEHCSHRTRMYGE